MLSYTHFNTLYINSLTTIPSKIALRQPLVSSLANPKKLIRLQRTAQSSIKPASKDVYNIALNSDGPRAIDRDDSFHSYIACKAEEIFNAFVDKGIAKDVETQSAGSSIGLSSKGETLYNFNNSKATISLLKNRT